MSSSFPFSKNQQENIGNLWYIISKRAKSANKLSPSYKMLAAELNKNEKENQKFKCNLCDSEFENVNKRSAHMNKHSNKRKSKMMKQQHTNENKSKKIKKERKEKKQKDKGQLGQEQINKEKQVQKQFPQLDLEQ